MIGAAAAVAETSGGLLCGHGSGFDQGNTRASGSAAGLGACPSGTRLHPGVIPRLLVKVDGEGSVRRDAEPRGPGPSAPREGIIVMRRSSAARRTAWSVCSWLGLCCGLMAAEPITEVEEVVATCKPPGNGAGPLWCYGAPLVVRQGDRVFASLMETGVGVPPPCNTRWRLYRRDAGGWQDVRHAADFREREPCPLASPGPGRLLLSVNPSTEPPGTQYGRCDPHLLRLRRPAPRSAADRPPSRVVGDAPLRGPFLPGARRRCLARGRARPEHRRRDAAPSIGPTAPARVSLPRSGTIRFPIRACYPQVAIRDRSAHVLAIGDIVEPNEAWRAYKKKTTGSEWDYVFRRLFYARSPDLSAGRFRPTDRDRRRRGDRRAHREPRPVARPARHRPSALPEDQHLGGAAGSILSGSEDRHVAGACRRSSGAR